MAQKQKDASGFVKGVMEHMAGGRRGESVIPKRGVLLRGLRYADRLQNAASVKSSIALTENQKYSIKQLLESLVEHELDVDFSFDNTLIAGFKIQIGDFVVDTSFSNQLERMGKALLQQTLS